MSSQLNQAILNAADIAVAPTLELIAESRRPLSLRDIRGPAIVYVTFGGCGSKDTHNFDHIRAIAAASNRPVYAITLTPDSDLLKKSIGYVDKSSRLLNEYPVPGIHIFPTSSAEALLYANQHQMPVNKSSISGHSNRLVFIDGNGQVQKSIPSTQPIDSIKKMMPSFFSGARDRGPVIG